MASIWRHPKSNYWTACYTSKEGKRIKRSTKQTSRARALAVAWEWERFERRGRQECLSTLQIQKLLNDLFEQTRSDIPLTPAVERSMEAWLASAGAKNAEPGATRFGQTVDPVLQRLLAASLQRSVIAGEKFRFTPRQQEVLGCLAHGYSYKEIAERLHLRVRTVSAHIRGVYEKLHVHSRSQAVAQFLGI